MGRIKINKKYEALGFEEQVLVEGGDALRRDAFLGGGVLLVAQHLHLYDGVDCGALLFYFDLSDCFDEYLM